MAVLYLHIGEPKTGTSSLQAFLYMNRHVLNKKGYSYPDFGITFEGKHHARNAQFLIHKVYDNKKNNHVEKENEIVSNCLSLLEKQAEKYPNIILSDEGIWRGAVKKQDFWKNVYKWTCEKKIDLKVIVYLRRQDYIVQSCWAQQVKEKSTLTFDAFIKNGKQKYLMLDYYKQLKEISDVIGKENLLIEIYDKNIRVIENFLQKVGLELTDEYNRTDIVKNVSLTGKYLEAKRLLNYNAAFKMQNTFILDLLRELQERDGAKTDYQKVRYFTTEEQRDFLCQYEEGNRLVAREFLGRENGVLFEEDTSSDVSEEVKKVSVKDAVWVLSEVIRLQQTRINELKKKTKASGKKKKQSLFGKVKKFFRM